MNKKEAREKMINIYDNFDICIQNVMDAFEEGKAHQAAFYLGILKSAADDIFDEFENVLDHIEDTQAPKMEFYAAVVEKDS